ncbi:YgjV family protein [Methylobacterium sp. NEAU 140]|uniref:YgjV family protein n=1 Tax=Methylobacterium sp. NEAU 140 TaxID=3064945 RepID=UPI0027355232|nr:YgjV family protein [Methylobacterium sp. NEAU 140]MDP4022963.1 YgjV family protein [Methylobacterium sp. NEAU 140]
MTFRDTISIALDAVIGRIDIFGALGLVLGFVSGVMPGRVAILVASAACSTCFGLHFLRLGAGTGAAMCALSVAQSLAAARFGGRDRRPAWFAPFFGGCLCLVLGLTAATWSGWPSACAGTGALLAMRARLQPEAGAMRASFLAASLAWAGHNLLVGSAFGLTCDLLTLSGLLLAMGRARPATAAA